MKNKILIRLLMATALLILAFPVVAAAQSYNRGNRANSDRYDRFDRRNVRDAIARLDFSSARLQNEVSIPRGSTALGGLLWVSSTDNTAIAEVRDFRNAVRQLRHASDGGRDLRNSYDEARMVLERGVQLDRYLRLRTGSTNVDADLSEIRSNLHLIADAYDMRIPY